MDNKTRTLVSITEAMCVGTLMAPYLSVSQVIAASVLAFFVSVRVSP